MKNSVSVVLSIILVLFIALGCSLSGLTGGSDSASGDDRTKKTGESKEMTEKEPSGEVVKVGIPECDEVATYINDNSEEIEGSIILRGIVYIYKNAVLENIKENIEKMTDEEKQKYGKICKKTLEDLKKSMNK
ncbi:MAG: hypothetical protein HKN25_02590 [Pyrinomonadaceae bacterium]|nr:hypothetical protein [Pyrinomonadaceae bacterium]